MRIFACVITYRYNFKKLFPSERTLINHFIQLKLAFPADFYYLYSPLEYLRQPKADGFFISSIYYKHENHLRDLFFHLVIYQT